MILANAVVDVINEPDIGLGKFRVEVWGKAPYDYVRVYEVAASDADKAAREGLDLFTEDVKDIVFGKNES